MAEKAGCGTLVGVAGALTFGAGLLHVAAATSHRNEVPRLAAAFAVTALLQVAVAVALTARPRRNLLVVAALLNMAAAAVWLVSRQTGLPLVDELARPEAVGVQDLTIAVMEAAAAFAALVVARRDSEVRNPWPSPAWLLVVVPVLIGASAPHPPHRAHHHGGESAVSRDPVLTGADTSKASEEQVRAARDLVLRTRAAVAGRLSDEASVVAAGYRSIWDGRGAGSFEHFVKAAYLSDGRQLDPSGIESMVMEMTPSGKRVVSAMFILEVGKTMADVPEISRGLAGWHDHQDLCWQDGGLRLAGKLVNGRCVPGGTFVPTPPMLHVWLQDHPCGPFAGVDGHGAACAGAHRH